MMLFGELSPEELKTVGIVAVMVFAIIGAILYPIARAYAWRLEGGGATAALRDELADVSARLDGLQQSEGGMKPGSTLPNEC